MKLTIGIVARHLGLSTRYYEDIGLVPRPLREGAGWRSAGRRVYEESEIERLRFVKEARQPDFTIEHIRQLLLSYENGPPCGCGSRPLLKMLIERKLSEIEDATKTLETLRVEMQSLYVRTLALEQKTPGELMKSGSAKLPDAIFGRYKKPSDGKSQSRDDAS